MSTCTQKGMNRVIKLPQSVHLGVAMTPDNITVSRLERFTSGNQARKPYNKAKWLYTTVYDPYGKLNHLADSRIQNLLCLMYDKNCKEYIYRDFIADNHKGSRVEVIIESGIVDVLTPDAVIEVKKAENWKHALGQALAYSKELHKRPSVALIGQVSAISRKILSAYEVDIIDLMLI